MIKKLNTPDPMTTEEIVIILGNKIQELIDSHNKQEEKIDKLNEYSLSTSLLILALEKEEAKQNKKIDFIMENTGKEFRYGEAGGTAGVEYKTLKEIYKD